MPLPRRDRLKNLDLGRFPPLMERVRAARGSELRCKGWRQEAILRMLENNLENAEKPEDLIIYGGTGKAARNWDAFHQIVKALKSLENDETLLVQSGKPVAVFRTTPDAPRALIANANLVPHWSTWEQFHELERLVLTMHGQMTAGGWSYIGAQGTVQGTYETFAHDPLGGYIARGRSVDEAAALRASDPKAYVKKSLASIALHVRAMLEFKKRGSVVFEYGNNIRGHAVEAGVKNAFDFKGFVPLFIRPMFCEGRGPFRWVAVSGDPQDILRTDEVVMREFPENATLVRWIKLAEANVPWEGLPARVCWLGYGERARFGKVINRMVATGELSGPIVITRDHLDAGSVASPYRETEGMRDGSDAIADWPILNALLN